MQAALYIPPTVHGPIQYEADDVTEVLGVQRATRGTAHVTADGHGDLAHFWVAVVTTKENTPNASRTCNNRSEVINLYPLANNSTPRNTNYLLFSKNLPKTVSCYAFPHGTPYHPGRRPWSFSRGLFC